MVPLFLSLLRKSAAAIGLLAGLSVPALTAPSGLAIMPGHSGGDVANPLLVEVAGHGGSGGHMGGWGHGNMRLMGGGHRMGGWGHMAGNPGWHGGNFGHMMGRSFPNGHFHGNDFAHARFHDHGFDHGFARNHFHDHFHHFHKNFDNDNDFSLIIGVPLFGYYDGYCGPYGYYNPYYCPYPYGYYAGGY